MTLTAGTKLGPYEILSPLGAGGMGEVYRARDERLKRDVAIKVLPASFSDDPDRLRRFEQEAQAAGALNHPNITAVFDVGHEGGAPYVVSELLEGESLNKVLSGGKLPPRRAIDYALQVAHGLAAAHEKGIVHRDLKPDNLFVTNDGRVKILDFGLAKLMQSERAGSNVTNLPTETQGTEPGMVLGTLGYMSPEQVKGKPADARSDIFSVGAILYEMLSGSRAFRRESAAETMSAILREEPPDLSATNRSVSPGLERIVRHCLEKTPERRFHSAHDLAFDLEALSGVSSASAAAIPAARKRLPRWMLLAGGVALLAAVAAAAFFAGRSAASARAAGATRFKPLTYRTLPIFRALFAPDGRSVVFSQAKEGNRPEIFTLAPDYPEPRSLGLTDAQLLSISSKGELALLTHTRYVHQRLFTGTLARMPLGGSAPREVLNGVREADWHPGGEDLAIIREVDGKDRLEYPIGKVLYSTGGYLSDVRFSRAGDRIAFLEHPFRWDDRGGAVVVDLSGKKTSLAGGYWGAEGMAWSPDDKEVLFSAGTGYASFAVHAVTLAGKERIALQNGGGFTIFDVSPDGRWLGAREDLEYRLMVMTPGAAAERNLSWLDASYPVALSRDGSTLLFSEFSGAFGANYAVCIRKTDGSPVVRLGEGWAADLSPDGRWALAVVPSSPDRLMLYPTGPGEPRRLESGEIREYSSAKWFPDGNRVLTCGTDARRISRCYAQEISGGAPRPVTPEGTRGGIVSPDGALLLVQGRQNEFELHPAAGGEPKVVSALTPDDNVFQWSSDGRSVFAIPGLEVPARLDRVELTTGRRELWHRLAPSDLTGVVRIYQAIVAGDLKSYAYCSLVHRDDLFLVEGAR